jgi:hypothetical protein
MTYERVTAASIAQALERAVDILTDRLPTEKVAGDDHSVTLSGGDGTVTISAHRHGPETIVNATTDQLRTSRLDIEVQYYLTMLPYQPGDQRGQGEALPGGLSAS